MKKTTEQKKIERLEKKIKELENDLVEKKLSVEYWIKKYEDIAIEIKRRTENYESSYSRIEGANMSIREERDWLRDLVMGITLPAGREDRIAEAMVNKKYKI